MAIFNLVIGSRVPSIDAGLSLYAFDEDNGRLTFQSSYSGISNATFQAYNKKAGLIYSVSEIQEKQGSVQTFRFDPTAKQPFSLIGTILSGGASPCHLALSPDCTHLAVSNYSDGVFTLFALDSQGNIMTTTHRKQFVGVGHDPIRQEASHIHSALWTQDARNIFVADLGLDRIVHYNKENWTLPSFKKVPLGTGPRHMALSNDNQHLYIAGELSNQIVIFYREKLDNSFTYKATIPTLPPNYTEINTVADIHLSADGNYLYCSNRGHDSIVSYAVDAKSGMLKLIGHTPTLGKEPRNFALSPNGSWLLVANGSSDSIVVFPRDKDTGMIKDPVSTIAVKQPVCLLFTLV